ncbi:MAG TPA: hypothetical protein VFG69_03205 [Nannocystaceae bacterium]|nr:hypothetical protein [Nannocystaceae bacterium]
MRRIALLTTFLASLTATVALQACNEGELDCRQLCKKGQDEDCTTITGDCGDFCESLTNVQDESGCGDERESYSDCLNGEGVCSSDCNGEESALTSCLSAYCATRLDDADCMTLIASFN